MATVFGHELVGSCRAG